MRILVVRLSSMGDMIHSLPAVTDASKALQDLEVDWAVDHAFSEIPAWHHAVSDVLSVPHRSFSNLRISEFRGFYNRLRRTSYDAVIDLQGHWKSATVARLAKGKRYGYEKKSVNEWGAQIFYDQSFFVPREQHSILRMKELLARALDYKQDPGTIDYCIDRSRLPENSMQSRHPYLVFVHSTSWESKCWPENYWRDLTQKSIQSGFQVLLPWGNEAERQKAIRISADESRAVVLPPLTISQKASILAGAKGSVGLDTGLSHIAAALDVPSVTLYGATDPFFIGARGRNQVHIASEFECVKCHQAVCGYAGQTPVRPACFQAITPDIVWNSLEKLL